MSYPSCDGAPEAFVGHFPVHVGPYYLAIGIHTKFHGQDKNTPAVCGYEHEYNRQYWESVGLRNAQVHVSCYPTQEPAIWI